MDKYGDVEKAYRGNLDAWLCNLYFSIERKDSLSNPYTVQLILDEGSPQTNENKGNENLQNTQNLENSQNKTFEQKPAEEEIKIQMNPCDPDKQIPYGILYFN
jgi:hypothetical protein